MKLILFSILPILIISYILQFYVFDGCEIQMLLYDCSRQISLLLLSFYAYKNGKNIKDNLMSLGLITFFSYEFIAELIGGVVRGDITEVIWVILAILGFGYTLFVYNK